MQETIKQAILIISLVLVIAYDADAQTAATNDSVNDAANSTACSLVAAGFINGNYANIRIAQDGQVIAGADSLGEVISGLAELRAQGVCKVNLHPCELAIGGLTTSGAWTKQRLLVNGQPLFGAGDIGAMLATLKTLRAQNICD